MRAGLLTEIIKIFSKKLFKNETGEEEILEVLKRRCRARVSTETGQRTLENDEVTYSFLKTFHLRIHIDVCLLDIIEYKGKRYRILDIEEDRLIQEKTIRAELINE